jgi:alkyldihydroxyacetonephosphate synthase
MPGDLSFWGWGYADRFPDEDERRATAERLERELGFPERPLLDPPTMEEASVPDPRVGAPDLDCCTAGRAARIRHTYGRAYRDLVRGFRGEFDPAPDVVARPRDESEVGDVLAWAAREGVAVVPYGGGTSVVGGVEFGGEGYAGVVSLDTREMDRVLDVNHVDRTARIQAGATGPVLQEQLAEEGLQLRHYPQSYEFSTLGGWVATRAGGHFATRYTHVDDFVQGVRAVTPAGTLETGGVPASGAGPDPNRFLLGSEGAFGVVTDATLRVQPRPTHRSRATVRFDDWEAAVAATREVVQARLTPAQCRLLDRNEAMLEEVAMDGSHVLLLGFESLDGPCEAALSRALAHCEDRGGTVSDGPTHSGPDDRDRGDESGYRSAFFEAPYRYNELVSLGVLVDTFETAVTWDRFPALHEAVRERVLGTLREACGGGFVGCRFTHVYPDGPAPYYTVLAPADVGRELEQWRAVKRAASAVLADHGATITHHHAVGRVHREWYDREVPDEFRQALGAMKRTLDPEGIMNPGVLVD